MVRVDDAGDVTKCWLSPEELDLLERTAGGDDWEREVAVQLMGRCGIRASEVSYLADEHLRWSEKGDIWLFEVRGKNSEGWRAEDSGRLDARGRRQPSERLGADDSRPL